MPSPTREQLLQLAKWILQSRKRRVAFFHPGLFGEPAWDVLLTLYVGDRELPSTTVSELASVANVATATMLRWVHTLEDQGLIARQPQLNDKCPVLVGLEPVGIQTIEKYLCEILASST